MNKPASPLKRLLPMRPYLWTAVIVTCAILVLGLSRLISSDPVARKSRARGIIVSAGGEVRDQSLKRITDKVFAEMRDLYPESQDDFQPSDYDESITIPKIRVTDRLIDAIGDAGKSVSLELDDPIIDEDAWRRLLLSENIAELRLHGEVFNANRVAQAAMLPSLDSLQLVDTRIIDHQPTSIFTRKTQIKELEIWNTPLSDELCREIGSLDQLRSLSLIDVALTNDQLRHFSGLQSLNSFALRYHAENEPMSIATDDGFEFLEMTTNLVNFDLRGVRVTDSLFHHLAKLTKLKRLLIYGANISGTDLDRLRNVDKLRILALVGAPVSDQTLQSLPPLPRLEELDSMAHTSRQRE
jgi:hypothetical protein